MAKLNEQPAAEVFSADDMKRGSNRSGFAAQALYSFVERLERLDEERAGLVEDMKEVRGEAKGVGFDTKIISTLLRRRKMDTADRMEADALLETYEEAVRAEEKRAAAESLEQGE